MYVERVYVRRLYTFFLLYFTPGLASSFRKTEIAARATVDTRVCADTVMHDAPVPITSEIHLSSFLEVQHCALGLAHILAGAASAASPI